jgi:alpha-mannosidase
MLLRGHSTSHQRICRSLGFCSMLAATAAFGTARLVRAVKLASSPQSAPAREVTQRKPDASAEPTLWIIPHSHWEGAVFKTREEYPDLGLPHILTALNLMRKYPIYRFVLDQVAYVRPFLERYPEEMDEFRKFEDEGRLQIVGANDVMLDVNIPSGESCTESSITGKRSE